MHGFAIWVDRGRKGPISDFAVERTDCGTTLSSKCLGMYTRPLASTPEAKIELQPLVDPTIILSYTGRIDNRREVAELLGQPELAFAADGTVMAAAYAAWGRAFPAKLDGEYSFVVVDRHDGKVVAGRDALGIHKLYVLEETHRVWIASNLALLLASVPKEPEISPTGAADFIGGGGTLGPLLRTLFRGITYVRPGHTLVDEGRFTPVQQQRFWTPRVDREIRLPRRRDYEEMFRTLVFDSVETALRAPNPVCTELSGGLDSSTVTVAAALLREKGIVDRELVAFSLSASDTRVADETEYQAQVLSEHKIDHQQFDLDSLTDLLQVEKVSQPSLVDMQGWFLEGQRKVAAEYSPTVCLTGQGGDAVFCVAFPPLHLAGLVRQAKMGAWAREVWNWLGTGRFNLWNLLWVYSRGDRLNALTKLPPAPSWLTVGARRQVRDATRAIVGGRGGRFSADTRAFHLNLITTLAAVLPDQERFPWENRCPLLARSLVEFMIAVPREYKATLDSNRVLQRAALANVLPKSIVERKTKGDFTPRLFSALRRRWDFWEPLTHGTYLADLGIVEPFTFRDTCEALRQGLAGEGPYYLCGALILEGWLRARRTRSNEPSIQEFRRGARTLG